MGQGGLSGPAAVVKRSGAPQARDACYMPAMSDRLFMALMAAAAVAMISLSAVWPQGLGARSPGPFGHTPVQQTPEARAAMARQAEATRLRHQAQIQAATAQLRRVTTSAPASGAKPKADPAASLRPDQ